jgi:ElaB/YqjD/DUF883 family membrane-anchored ribosome-binding protein
VQDAEKLLANSTDEHSHETMEALRERLAAAQDRLGEIYTGARDKLASGARRTDEAIRDHPYEVLVAAVGIGVLIGLLLGRRR